MVRFLHGRTLTLLLAGVLATPAAGRAEPIAEESFDYKAGTPLKEANGGVGWDGAWFTSPLNPRDNEVIGPGMKFPGLSTAGSCMRQIGRDVRSFRRIDTNRKQVAHLVEEGQFGKTFGKDGTTIWIGFLIAMPSHPRSAYGGIHLCDGLGDLKKDPFGDKKAHQRISLGRSNTSDGWYLGRVTNGGPGSGKWNSKVASDKTTRLLVYRFDFKKGDEEAWLHVDPKPGQAPDPKTAAIHAEKVTDFRFNTLSVGAGGGAEFHVDEIRIGTEFADVVPAARQEKK
jgi:hypothetical protein